MTDTNMHVVTATSFEYNDEVHSITEDGGGTPVAAFANKQDADDDARRRIIDDFLLGWAGDQLHCFGYGLDDIFKRKPDFIDMDEELFFDDDQYHDLGEIIDTKKLSRPELEHLADCLSIRPFAVTEVSVG